MTKIEFKVYKSEKVEKMKSKNDEKVKKKKKKLSPRELVMIARDTFESGSVNCWIWFQMIKVC